MNKNEAIAKLELDIKEKQSQIDLIKSIDFESRVDEDKWHMICETPLRNSDLLIEFVKSIFKNAIDVSVGCNYVKFNLYGFKCAIPTSRCNGIEVDTTWYEKDRSEPKKENIYCADRYYMKKYFDALDKHESWKILFKYRLPRLSGYRTWVKFLLWFCKYKWKDAHREKWEEEFKKDEQAYEINVKQYHVKREEIHKMSIRFRDELLPELYTFTNRVRKYIGNNYEPKDILELEGLK